MTTYVGLDSKWTEEFDSGREYVALRNWSYLPKFNIDGKYLLSKFFFICAISTITPFRKSEYYFVFV